MRKTISLFLVNQPYLRWLLFAGCVLVLAVLAFVWGNRYFNQYVYVSAKRYVRLALQTGISVIQADDFEEKRKLLTLFKQEIRGYEQLLDFDKLNEIRKWASIHFDDATSRRGGVLVDARSVRYLLKSTTEEVDDFLRNESGGGFFCGGKARILAEIYRLLGFKASTVNYGFSPDSFLATHVVVLVEVGGKVYIQDPHTNGAYYRKDESPMPLGEILTHLANRSHHQINYVDDGPMNYRLEYHVRKPPDASCIRKASDHYICTTEIPALVRARPFVKDFEKKLVKIGLPGVFPYGLLHPFSLNSLTPIDKQLPAVRTVRRLQHLVLSNRWTPRAATEQVKKSITRKIAANL